MYRNPRDTVVFELLTIGPCVKTFDNRSAFDDELRCLSFTVEIESTTSVVEKEAAMDKRISEAELEIMEALWRKAPQTAAEVAEDVSPDKSWSLQTVKTMLARLHEKRAVDHVKVGRRFLYSPQIDRADYVKGESQRFVDRLFGGKVMPLVAHLAERDRLSDDDIDEIERLIQDLKS